jgi:peptidoglycan/LPS O-acetylase OafA/YrhL
MPRRLHSLDLLRGVAILGVMLVHWPGTAGGRGGPLAHGVGVVAGLGFFGVDLFFVLSGFLISGLLFDELDRTGRIAAGRFWLRRGFKIWPAYFAGYGLFTVAVALQMTPERAADYLAGLWSVLVFAQNYTTAYQAWPASWSLAVEEHFYLALPLALALTCRLRPERAAGAVAALAAAVVVAVPVARAVAYTNGAPISSFYFPTHFRADALAAGVLACYLTRRYRPAAGRTLAVAALVAALAAWTCGTVRGATVVHVAVWGVTVLALLFGWLVVAASARPAWGHAGWTAAIGRPLAWLGTYSYTVYIAHAVIRRWPGADAAYRTLEASIGLWGMRAVYLAASVLAGVLLSHAVERPMLRARARWVPSGRRATKPARAPEAEPVGELALAR